MSSQKSLTEDVVDQFESATQQTPGMVLDGAKTVAKAIPQWKQQFQEYRKVVKAKIQEPKQKSPVQNKENSRNNRDTGPER